MVVGGDKLDGRNDDKVLYDNQWYRSEYKVSQVDSRFWKGFIRRTAILIALLVSCVVVLEYTISGEDVGHLTEKRIAVYGMTFGIPLVMTLIEIVRRRKERDMPLVITQSTIIVGHKRKTISLAEIKKVVFRPEFVTIVPKSQDFFADTYITSDIIWNIDKFKAEISRFCSVEVEGIGAGGCKS